MWEKQSQVRCLLLFTYLGWLTQPIFWVNTGAIIRFGQCFNRCYFGKATQWNFIPKRQRIRQILRLDRECEDLRIYLFYFLAFQQMGSDNVSALVWFVVSQLWPLLPTQRYSVGYLCDQPDGTYLPLTCHLVHTYQLLMACSVSVYTIVHTLYWGLSVRVYLREHILLAYAVSVQPEGYCSATSKISEFMSELCHMACNIFFMAPHHLAYLS